MEEENDDQWLYGEDSSVDKLPGTEDAVEKATETDVLATKAHDAFMNPPEEPDDGAGDLEPPIIQPLDANTFDNDAPPPGEEDILVPPFIAAPDSTSEKDENATENQAAVNGEGEGDKNEKTDRKLSEGEEEDDDDNINVVIGDIRTTPNYNATIHIKRGNLLTLTKGQQQKPHYYQQQQYQPGAGGKFAVDDFESVGVINGVAAHDFNLDNLEDKPWRKPGADITDYFNYGFNEDTWRAYCERQKRIRVHESGSGLIPMNTSNNVNIIPNVSVPPPNMMMPPVGVPPPDMAAMNMLNNANRRSTDGFAKENTIQVMTADRREYSKKNFTPDLSVPPPSIVPPPFGAIPPGMPPPFPPMNQFGPPPGEYFTPEMDPYYQSYEPTQEPGWGGPGPNWNSNVEIPISNGNDRSMGNNPDHKPIISDNGPPGIKIKTEPEDRDVSRERERDRTRDYDRERDSRHRDRSHKHRSRSRSHERRSRKHKSRSRSPGYRSHKKKKSKKSERSKSDSD